MNDRKTLNDRRCVLTGVSKPRQALIRLALGPDGTIVPDLAEKLPGRGVWISADKRQLVKAMSDGKLIKALARSLKTKVGAEAVEDDLAARIELLLKRRCLDRVGLEQRAGNLISGFDKIKAEIKSGKRRVSVMLSATDGGQDGKQKMKFAAGDDALVASLFSRDELSLALGKGNSVHAVIFESGGADILKADLARLQLYLGDNPDGIVAKRNEE